MPNIRLLIEYDGTAYAGWQNQASQPTVQGKIERALAELVGEKVTLYGAGRTDSGAHALGQVANFHAHTNIPIEKYALALQRLLPPDIVIHESTLAAEDFHSRYSASSRQYRYRIGARRSALGRNRRWETNMSPDLQKLTEAALRFVGEIDFASFCQPASLKEDNSCTVYSAEWRRIDTHEGAELHFDIRANRFLHGMIRSIVGLMTTYAQLRTSSRETGSILTLADVQSIIEARRWPQDQIIAPAHGLYLVSVAYD